MHVVVRGNILGISIRKKRMHENNVTTRGGVACDYKGEMLFVFLREKGACMKTMLLRGGNVVQETQTIVD